MCANEQTFATKWYDDDMFMIEAIAILHHILMCCGFNFDGDVANAFFPISLSEAWIIMNKFHKGSDIFFCRTLGLIVKCSEQPSSCAQINEQQLFRLQSTRLA